METQVTEERLRVRIGNEQTHYWGDLAAGALVLQLFGDVGGALGIRTDGIGGLLAGYENVRLFHPVHTGDLVEVVARRERVGNTSRTTAYEAYVVLSRFGLDGTAGRWIEFDPPILAATARGTGVVRKDQQFGGPLKVSAEEMNTRARAKTQTRP